jgi:hypothetical protein
VECRHKCYKWFGLVWLFLTYPAGMGDTRRLYIDKTVPHTVHILVSRNKRFFFKMPYSNTCIFIFSVLFSSQFHNFTSQIFLATNLYSTVCNKYFFLLKIVVCLYISNTGTKKWIYICRRYPSSDLRCSAEPGQVLPQGGDR